jgi:hypothetical protein
MPPAVPHRPEMTILAIIRANQQNGLPNIAFLAYMNLFYLNSVAVKSKAGHGQARTMA